MKYMYLGVLMILIGTLLAISISWKLAVILFLVIQGNTIVQGTNDRINKANDEIYK